MYPEAVRLPPGIPPGIPSPVLVLVGSGHTLDNHNDNHHWLFNIAPDTYHQPLFVQLVTVTLLDGSLWGLAGELRGERKANALGGIPLDSGGLKERT